MGIAIPLLGIFDEGTSSGIAYLRPLDLLLYAHKRGGNRSLPLIAEVGYVDYT